ncbi:MAG: purine-nucleoside phosphorylase [Planctomycetia bacterium]|nr:purine-nucleoside phosphorylase [Planctomycetia bacterium]
MAEFDLIQEAADFIRQKWNKKPQVGIVLGTGLGNLANKIETELVIPYEEIPYFPKSTVETHAGKLILGTLEGKTVFAMQGRFHYYEGYSAKRITFPIRVMKQLGVELLVVSNACGGLNPQFKRGDIMLIEDHINLLGINPLIQDRVSQLGVDSVVETFDSRLGPRFPDMIEPYSHELIHLAQQVALENKIATQKGVYVAVSGPNLETRAEYRFLRNIGADVVGMSTVPEVLVAVHSNIKVLGLSIVTDMGLPDALEPANISDILAAAENAEPKMNTIICGVLQKLTFE